MTIARSWAQGCGAPPQRGARNSRLANDAGDDDDEEDAASPAAALLETDTDEVFDIPPSATVSPAAAADTLSAALLGTGAAVATSASSTVG
jgi:hypothetical protein